MVVGGASTVDGGASTVFGACGCCTSGNCRGGRGIATGGGGSTGSRTTHPRIVNVSDDQASQAPEKHHDHRVEKNEDVNEHDRSSDDNERLVVHSSSLFGSGGDEGARRWLELAAPARDRVVDPRIAAATRRIRDDPAGMISARELATEAGLSDSRFLHLFRQEVGTSLRRYRLWVRLVHAGTALAAGRNLTMAAAESGFASPSHLADRFKATFGLSATQLLATGLIFRTT